MENSPLLLCRPAAAEALSDAPVHIPFDIGYPGIHQKVLHLAVDAVHHLFSCKIKDKLVSSMGNPAARCFNPVIWVAAEQIAVLIDHLRLEPETKFHLALFLDSSG